ncbi:hypothetical protein OA385_05915 [Paracoccaceae bacterium]|nr:hypothetical protein [Paracoccaceae bacterium]
MIENFNNIYLLLLYMAFLGLIGFYCFRMWFSPSGVLKEFNIGEEGTYLVRVIGTFAFAFLFMGLYILFRPTGPMGAWIFFNILFLTGTAQAFYDTAFYFKILDKNTGAKNSLVDVIVGIFFMVGSIILIIGLSDKIYAFS